MQNYVNFSTYYGLVVRPSHYKDLSFPLQKNDTLIANLVVRWSFKVSEEMQSHDDLRDIENAGMVINLFPQGREVDDYVLSEMYNVRMGTNVTVGLFPDSANCLVVIVPKEEVENPPVHSGQVMQIELYVKEIIEADMKEGYIFSGPCALLVANGIQRNGTIVTSYHIIG